MRILYVNHTGHVSGAERVLLDMVRAVDRTQYQLYVLCPAEGRLADEIKAGSIPCLPLPPVNARFTLRPHCLARSLVSLGGAIWELRRRVLELQPDLIHANTIRSGIMATIATAGTAIPVIWHVHDILPKHVLSSAVRMTARMSRRTHIAAVSHAAAKEFCGSFDFGGRVRTIHNGTDFTKFPQKNQNELDFRERFGIPADAFLVCAVGQVCARKGLRELVTSFQQVHQRAPRMHLVIVGRAVFKHEEEYLAQLRELATTSACGNRIHFTGELRDVSPALQAADLLVLNSRQEPFGLVLVEAMASGTPVLATRVGGIPEIVSDSENGWLVDSGDIDQLAAKLLELSLNPEALDRAARVGRTITCPQFSLERFQRSLGRMYSEFETEPSLKWELRNQPALSGLGKS